MRLAAASEDAMEGALSTAWKLRVEKNAKAGKKSGKLRVPNKEKRTAKKKKG